MHIYTVILTKNFDTYKTKVMYLLKTLCNFGNYQFGEEKETPLWTGLVKNDVFDKCPLWLMMILQWL